MADDAADHFAAGAPGDHPNIVNTYIGLFKDTTLVFIVGIFDLLRTIEVSRIDPKWATPVTSTTGYAVAAYSIWCSATHVALRAGDRNPASAKSTDADDKGNAMTNMPFHLRSNRHGSPRR